MVCAPLLPLGTHVPTWMSGKSCVEHACRTDATECFRLGGEVESPLVARRAGLWRLATVTGVPARRPPNGSVSRDGSRRGADRRPTERIFLKASVVIDERVIDGRNRHLSIANPPRIIEAPPPAAKDRGRTDRSGTRVVLRMGPDNQCAWDRTCCGGTESRLYRFVCVTRRAHTTVARAHGCNITTGIGQPGKALLSHAHSHPPVHELRSDAVPARANINRRILPHTDRHCKSFLRR